MWDSGFFNSINGDRLYNAEQMSNIFEGLITNGVFESVGNKLAVQVSSGMTVQIATGRGWFSRKWVNNTTPHLITLEASDVTLNRYAAVCVRVDTTNAARTAEPYIKYSDFATAPEKPNMERTETLNEYCLAYVYIPAGSSAVTAANIEDTRGNTELCGWVTGLIDQLDTTTLFEQYNAIFNEWFSGLQGIINENTETMLVTALPVSLTVTLSALGWTASTAGYTQTVQIAAMNASKTVLVQPEDASATNYSAAEIECTAQGDGTLEFTAVSLPTEDVAVNIVHMGV